MEPRAADVPVAGAPQPQPRPGERLPWHVAFLIPLLIALLLRGGFVLEAWSLFPAVRETAEGFDQHTYRVWAEEIAAGDFLGRGRGAFYYAPLYPYLLAFVYKISDAGGVFPAMVLNVLCGIATALLAAGLARRLAGNLAGLIAGLIAAVSASQMVAELFPLNDALLPPLTLGALWLLLSGTEEDRMRWMLGKLCGAGLLFGLLALGRASNLLPIAAVGVWLAFHSWKNGGWQRVLELCAPVLVTLLLVLSPVVIRNGALDNEWTLTTNGPVNLFIGNVPDSPGVFAYPHGFEETRSRIHALPREERAAAWRLARRTAWHGTTDSHLELQLRKLRIFLGAWMPPDNYNHHFFAARMASLRWTVPPMLLILLGIFGWGLTLRDWRRWMPLYLFAGAFALSISVVFVSGRFKLPFHALLAVFAGCGLAWLPTMLRAKWMGWLAGSAILMLLMVPMVDTKPVPAEAYAGRQRANDLLLHGSALAQRERHAEARALFLEGIEGFPSLRLSFEERAATSAWGMEDYAGVVERTQPLLVAGTHTQRIVEVHVLSMHALGRSEEAALVALQGAKLYPRSELLRQIVEP